jgi:HAD superfamily hydrolase (TIGR01509 family)
MSGGLFGQALLREIGPVLEPGMLDVLRQRHAEAYLRLAHQVRPLPGSVALLERLTAMGCAWAIATSGRMETARHILDSLPIPEGVPVITRDLVRHAKPDPDLVLAAVEKLGTDPMDTMVVGDSVWDMLAAQHARALGIGLLSGGYGEDELARSGAYRVFADPAGMLHHLDELGVR